MSIRGEPTYNSLSTIYKEIKTNANSVAITLDGESHGHLGLVISQTAYARIAPEIPYLRTEILGFLDIVRDGTQYQIVQPRDGTQYQIAQAQEVHRRTLKGFNETNLLERTLIQQIKETVKRDYIEV
jgi:hypothetical protein